MERRLEDFIEATMRAATARDVGEILKRELIAEGYENVVFVKTRNMLLQRIVWAELPDGYAPAYQENAWDRVDPVLKFAAATAQPFTWAQARRGREDDKVKAFFEECRVLGVHSGLTIPLRTASNQLDLVSVSVRTKDKPPAARLSIVYAMAVQTWLRHSELELEFERPKAVLSRRELETLRWMRDGKTNSEIAEILGISEKTVQFHAANIFRALGVNSRLEAIVVALQTGLITL
ncbi:helix-turn-helix transcriptional regulator [Chenggangzhangella methanolivorans]|uniref:LuxR C-terminal-related transcriptional regulator n=1 Tax=Chenggangzhangella methanolivorans TaxID=1437009 RepID=A0A9E6UNJ9_9HYPH|nr:LuxR family transcriptional regulator [Chenggangzhangella methanolivorans]QZO01186.1 LuxR C-terminal-related transcriptional regulator [Chenggangzhangella methanolivorans]